MLLLIKLSTRFFSVIMFYWVLLNHDLTNKIVNYIPPSRSLAISLLIKSVRPTFQHFIYLLSWLQLTWSPHGCRVDECKYGLITCNAKTWSKMSHMSVYLQPFNYNVSKRGVKWDTYPILPHGQSKMGYFFSINNADYFLMQRLLHNFIVPC